jgi:flavin reductase (DIM6/NTAB) family NADH-FMN oxidoreductase RutF
MTIEMAGLTTAQKQSWLLSAVAPRPIALASTINRRGQINLSPFSFFNVFSSEPPIVIFSPSLKIRDGARKHTLMNLEEVPQVAISIVDASILDRVNHASAEFPHGVNEFEEAGFTQHASSKIHPPFVKESKLSMECKVIEIKPVGKKGGAGSLIICEVLMMHVDESIIDTDGRVSPIEFQQIARLGGDWYARMDASVLFKLPKPPIV